MTAATFSHLEPAQTSLAFAAVLRYATDSGLLNMLSDAPRTTEEAARRAGVAPHRLAMVLRSLAHLGIVEARDELWSASPAAAAQAHRRVQDWQQLALAVAGRPAFDKADQAVASARYAGRAQMMADLYTEEAATAYRALKSRLPAHVRVLEPGGGAATWSRTFAKRHPAVHVDLLDLEEVIGAAEASLAADGLLDAYQLVPGDMFKTMRERRSTADLVILGNVLHLFSPTAGAELVQLAANAARRPGGLVAVIDCFSDLESTDWQAYYCLRMLLTTTDGAVYPSGQVAGWLRDAGLTMTDLVPLDAGNRLHMLVGAFS